MRRLVHLDEEPPLATPLLLLGELREIDPAVELVHFGEVRFNTGPLARLGPLQDWRLGAVRPSPEREKAGRTVLYHEGKRAVKNMQNVLLGRLLVQGFAQIARYLCTGVPGQGLSYDDEGDPVNIVEDFRERDHQYRNAREERFERNLDITDRGPERREKDGILRDKLHTDGREEFRRAKRGALILNSWEGR